MKRHFIGLAAIALSMVFVFSAASVYAQQRLQPYGLDRYQAEASALFETTDDTTDTTLFGFRGEYYFEPVKLADHPYREAAFLERIGSVFATIANFDVDDPGGGSGDGPLFGLGVNYAKPTQPFVVRAEYSRAKIDLDLGGNTTDNEILLQGGYYITDGLLAGVQYNNSELELAGSPTIENTGYGLFAKYIGRMMDNYIGVNGSIGTGKRDQGGPTLDNFNVAIAGDYFFTRAISAGLGLGVSSGDDKANEGTTWSANVDYFFTPRYSVRVLYSMFSNDNSGFDDENSLEARVGARF
jgi:hypothetical protein